MDYDLHQIPGAAKAKAGKRKKLSMLVARYIIPPTVGEEGHFRCDEICLGNKTKIKLITAFFIKELHYALMQTTFD